MSISGFPGRRSLAVLIDPDKSRGKMLSRLLADATKHRVDYIFAGGSLTSASITDLIRYIREKCTIPVVLFPGNLLQLSTEPDAILLLSLISGRNPELLIGNHVLAAPMLRNVKEKLIPVGYILIDCGSKTSVEYISQTSSIPGDKTDIITATALAGEMLGMKMIYLEGGSGARFPVPPSVIRSVRESISVPVAVGGGIRMASEVEAAYSAGADLVILGNGIEKDPSLLGDACKTRDKIRKLKK